MKVFQLGIHLLLIQVCSCGDLFDSKKKIVGNYYLVEIDNNRSICYKTKDGDYIGRVSNVVKYGVVADSLIIAKTGYRERIQYYIIKMRRDFEYAETQDFLDGPISETQFQLKYEPRMDFKLTPVK